MSYRVNVHDGKSQLSALLSRVEAREEVVIRHQLPERAAGVAAEGKHPQF